MSLIQQKRQLAHHLMEFQILDVMKHWYLTLLFADIKHTHAWKLAIYMWKFIDGYYGIDIRNQATQRWFLDGNKFTELWILTTTSIISTGKRFAFMSSFRSTIIAKRFKLYIVATNYVSEQMSFNSPDRKWFKKLLGERGRKFSWNSVKG